MKALPVARLSAPAVFTQERRQLAVVKVGDRVFAIDNRCPHEGYPLAAGSVSADCVLTCNWHNWKFRLEDGSCVVGGDHVRAYPTRVEDGHVWVELVDPPAEEVERRILHGLRTVFEERDHGRICREIARLGFEGRDPVRAVRAALDWWHDRLEYGTTHAMAATTDWLALAARWSEDRERRLICLAEAVDHLAFDSLRHPRFPYADAGEYFAPLAFQSSVDAEDVASAEAMVRRGLEDGLTWAGLEDALLGAALAHYLDFGHSVIYVQKAGQLAAQLGRPALPHIALPLARQICYATREDLIPEFTEYRRALDALPDPRPQASEREADGSLDRPAVPFPATLSQGFSWLAAALDAHPLDAVYDALVEALALNLLHYDTGFETATDRSVSQNVGWLDFSHGLTFANAVRELCGRHPTFWRPALLQMACFLGRNRSFLDLELDRQAWHVADATPFLDAAHEHLLDHGLRDPIFAAHHLKTTVAVAEELRVASPSCRQTLLDGLNRFLHSPIKTKHVRRNARQALALVGRDYDL